MPTGGANGGGGAAYIYKKGRLLVALGGGGGAGNSGNGGNGGGIGVAGQNGGGRGGGTGGSTFETGTLPTIGVFPGGQIYGGVNWSSPTAGRVSGCTIGNEYFTSRFSPVMIWDRKGSVILQETKYHKHLSYREDINQVLDIETTVVMVLAIMEVVLLEHRVVMLDLAILPEEEQVDIAVEMLKY